MFKGIGQIAGLMGQLPRIREEMDKLQQRLPQITAEGDAGAGMVKVSVNGRLEMIACALSEEVMQLGDREMLEDLIRAATNQAIDKARAAGRRGDGQDGRQPRPAARHGFARRARADLVLGASPRYGGGRPP